MATSRCSCLQPAQPSSRSSPDSDGASESRVVDVDQSRFFGDSSDVVLKRTRFGPKLAVTVARPASNSNPVGIHTELRWPSVTLELLSAWQSTRPATATRHLLKLPAVAGRQRGLDAPGRTHAGRTDLHRLYGAVAVVRGSGDRRAVPVRRIRKGHHGVQLRDVDWGWKDVPDYPTAAAEATVPAAAVFESEDEPCGATLRTVDTRNRNEHEREPPPRGPSPETAIWPPPKAD